ncbi:MAG: alpha/beta hydrolase [Flavobacteriia bacterium]
MKFFTILFTLISLNYFLHSQELSDSLFVLGEKKSLFSKQLNENRKLNIYLPEGYNKNDSIKYPVIYLLDGSADEDFIHICGIVQFLNYPWIASLEKSIVVGIENVDRKRDFTFPTTVAKDKIDFPTTASSSKFIAFIELELQQFIKEKYKITEHKTLIGQSLGGLLASEILAKKPLLFNRFIIISPSLWWDNESLFKEIEKIEKKDLNANTEIYFAVGNEGKVMVNDVKKLNKRLHSKELNPFFEYFPKENHATILHNAVYDAFLKFKDVKK